MSFSALTANLLAAENLKVVQANVDTASFDVANRVLTLPTFVGEFEQVSDMMVCHEVGHALYTNDYFNEIFTKATSIMRTYYNICEDARIEKLIKRQYPGLRKVMAEGYKVFNDKGMFIPKEVNVNTLSLIDRINIYFKSTMPVAFSLEEKVLVDKVANAETAEEVIAVAEEIYGYAKAASEDKLEEMLNELQLIPDEDGDIEEPGFGDGDADFDDFDEDEEGDEEGDESQGSGMDVDTEEGENESESQSKVNTGQNGEQMLESITQAALDKAMRDAADTKSLFYNIELQRKQNAKMIVSYERIIQEMNFRDPEGTMIHSGYNEEWDSFYTTTMRTVNFMVKEFEMKKAAHQLRYAQTARSGRLDMNKIFAYKLKDDLFRNITITPDAKNHGMVFLLDW